MTDRHPDRQTGKQNGMTIRLTLCEHDATTNAQQVVYNKSKAYNKNGV